MAGTAPMSSTMSPGNIGSSAYGRVVLTIKSSHNLTDKAFIGKSDPYCVVRVSDAEIQTAHVKNAGEHCVWDESFRFNNVSPSDIVTFKVYDHNRLIKDGFMGEGSISLRQVFEEGRLETRVPLASRTGVKDAGEVWISMRMEEGGAPGAGAGGMGAGTAGVGAGGLASESAYTETGKRYEGASEGMTGRQGMTERETGYGERERYESREAAVPASARDTYTTGTTTTGVRSNEYATTGEATQTGREAVCGQEFFTKVEDRPAVLEKVDRILEHRPVEKEFVVETRATGTEREVGRTQESMGTTARVVSEAQPRGPCE